MFLSRWTAHEQWNITFILLKTRRTSVRELLPDRHAKFVIIQWITCVVPKLANLLMHSQCALSEPISSAGKRENWQFVDVSRLQFTSDKSEFIPDYIETPMMKKYWKFNLHLCQEQLRNVRVSQFSSCFSWDDRFCESYTSYTRINYTCF